MHAHLMLIFLVNFILQSYKKWGSQTVKWVVVMRDNKFKWEVFIFCRISFKDCMRVFENFSNKSNACQTN